MHSSLRLITLCLLCLMTLLGCLQTSGAVPVKSLSVTALQKMDNAALLAYSKQCIEADTLHDEAITALSLIVNRFYKDQTAPGIRPQASEAFQTLGSLYMTRRIDYRKAYKNTQMALQIAREDNDHARLAAVLNNKAALYNFNNLDNADRLKMINSLLTQAVDEAVKGKDTDMILTATVNIIVGCLGKDGAPEWRNYSPVIGRIKDYCHDGKISVAGTVLELIDGADDLFAKRYDRAEKIFLSLLGHPDYPYKMGRMRMSLEIILYNIYLKTGQYDKGIPRLLRAKEEAKSKGWKDYEYTLTGDLANLYELKGDRDSLNYYYNDYLRQRADLQDRNGFGTVQLLDAGAEIERINSDLEAVSAKHNRQKRLLVLILCGGALLVAAVVFLLILHRNLRNRNRLLFARVQEQADRDEQYRALAKNWEQERAALEARLAPAAEPDTAPAQPQPSPVGEAPGVEDRELAQYYAAILAFMEESRQIYHPGFSLSDLARATRIPARTVSRAVNVCSGSNFPKLLADYRIREVIRLMRDPANDRFTIEMIAEQAGFQSRTSFSLLFKKSTGLTPSQYLKMMRLERL